MEKDTNTLIDKELDNIERNGNVYSYKEKKKAEHLPFLLMYLFGVIAFVIIWWMA